MHDFCDDVLAQAVCMFGLKKHIQASCSATCRIILKLFKPDFRYRMEQLFHYLGITADLSLCARGVDKHFFRQWSEIQGLPFEVFNGKRTDVLMTACQFGGKWAI